MNILPGRNIWLLQPCICVHKIYTIHVFVYSLISNGVMFSELIRNTRINRVRMVKTTRHRRPANRRCSGRTRPGDRLTFPRTPGPGDAVNSSPPDVRRTDNLAIRTLRCDKYRMHVPDEPFPFYSVRASHGTHGFVYGSAGGCLATTCDRGCPALLFTHQYLFYVIYCKNLKHCI